MAKAKKQTKDVAIIGNDSQVPDYIKQGEARGSEGVTTEDLTIPRLELVQSLSPARDKKEAAYIKGAEEGMLYNNVSRELYGEGVLIVPIIFKKQWLIWKDRSVGGGFRGAFDDMESAATRVEELVAEGDQGPFDINDTAQNLCLLVKVDDKGQLISFEEIAISMSRSKMKVSRQWNSMIRMLGGDRFSRVYQMSAVQATNDKNEKYFNFHVVTAGFTPEVVYLAAEKLYNEIADGSKNFSVNQDQDEPSEEGGPSEKGDF